MIVDRTQFLQGAGLLLVAFGLPGVSAPPSPAAQAGSSGASEANPLGPAVYPDVDSWLAVDPQGHVTIFFGKVELGTGVQTAVAQLAADELYVPFEAIHVIQGDTARTPNQGYTAGSQTLTAGAIPVRQAAAVARAQLLALGAEHLSAAPADCSTANGAVFVTSEPARRVTYGALIGGRRFDLTIPANPPLRSQTTFRVSGTSVPRIDIPAKIFGRFEYVGDVRVPHMLHGRVVYPPAPGATLASYDASGLHAIAPNIRVVRHGNFLGVVAAQEWDAIRAASALKVRWNDGPALPAMSALADVVRATPGTDRSLTDTGGTPAPSGGGVSATYSWPFQSHGSIGPSCSVADVGPHGVTVWSGTQGVYPLRDAIAQMLGRPAQTVRVIYTEAAGCYGQNGADDVAAAAVLLSRDAGAPVRVQYMRADETRWDPKGPAMVMSMHGSLAADGTVAEWDGHIWTPTHSQRPDGHAGNLLPALLAGTPPAPISYSGGDRDGKINYGIPVQHITITDQPTAVLRQSAMRGLGGTQNTFANESFMDELAHAAGADPLDFRLKHLTDPRERAVLEALRGDFTRGRGLAWVHYENTAAIVGAVADVSVDRKTGSVRVNHIWIAHDCGLVVNPNGLRNQIEGNAIQATSRAVHEAVQFQPHAVTSVDWVTYPILRFGEVPQVDIRLLDYPAQPVLGAGEATTTVIAPAIANAIFAQTGERVRSVPFTPQRVLAALSSA
jgi:CO/xanthine dehydrogenase Mo-binding subunit